MNSIPETALIRVHNLLYKMSKETIKEGDLVFDTLDNTYGVCDVIKGDRIAIKDGFAVELGVPMSRCRKLTHVPDHNSIN